VTPPASDGAPAATKRRERRKVYIVLPAFDEESRIGSLLERLDGAMGEASLDYRIILVDDGSRDSTISIVSDHASRMPISVVQHACNLGLGAAIRDGLVEAQRRSKAQDVIVTMDADDTHTPGLILRMVRMLREGHDVVIASRYRPGSRSIGVPLTRRLLSFGAALLFRSFFPIRGVRDYTCGYRAYRSEVLAQAIEHYGDEFLNQDGFQCMVDILLKLRRMHLIFGEVPIILRYDLKEGGTKMKVGETIRNTLLLMLRSRLSR